jgi:multidrug efflux system outer membrane protein
MKKFITILALTLISCNLSPKEKVPENSLKLTQEEKKLSLNEFLMQDILKEIVNEVQNNNYDIKISMQNLEIAKQNLKIANSYLIPSFNVSLESYKTNASVQMQPNYSALALTTYEVDIFGKIQSLRKIEKAQLLIAKEMHRSLNISVTYEALNLYFTLLAEKETIQEQKKIITLQEDYFELIKIKYKNEVISQKDFLNFSTTFNQIKDSFNAKIINYEKLKNAFIIIVGSEDKAEHFLSRGLLKDIDLNHSILYNSTSKALLARPDIKIAEHKLKIANANIGVARAAFFPSVNLFGSFGYGGSDFGNLFSDGKWVFKPSITIPIFTAGRNKGNLEIAKLRKEASIAEYEKVIQNAFLDVRFGLIQKEMKLKSLQFNQNALEDAKANFAFMEIKYKNGLNDISNFTSAGMEYLIAIQNFNLAKANYLNSLIYIFKSFGGE